MITVNEVYHILDRQYPYVLQEDYDNSGIMADCGREISRIVVSLDISNDVVAYAESIGAELIVSHHPIIFRPVRSIPFHTPLNRLMQAGISAISAHTNFDIAPGGVNDALAERLGLQNVTPVFQVSEKPVNGAMTKNYIGRTGYLPSGMTPAAFAAHVGMSLRGRSAMQFVDGGRPIHKVAVGGGACGEFIFECPENDIDAFVTGECKHHEMIFAKDNGITLVPAGHYATENVALEALAEPIRKACPDVEIFITRIDDPVSIID